MTGSSSRRGSFVAFVDLLHRAGESLAVAGFQMISVVDDSRREAPDGPHSCLIRPSQEVAASDRRKAERCQLTEGLSIQTQISEMIPLGSKCVSHYY